MTSPFSKRETKEWDQSVTLKFLEKKLEQIMKYTSYLEINTGMSNSQHRFLQRSLVKSVLFPSPSVLVVIGLVATVS